MSKFAQFKNKIKNFRPSFFVFSSATAILLICTMYCMERGGILNFPKYYNYIIYSLAGLSTAFLAWSIIAFVRGPFCREKIKKFSLKTKFTSRLVSDQHYKALFFTYVSFIGSTGWYVFKTLFGIYNDSVWFTVLAIYGLVLCFGKSVILGFNRKSYRFSNERQRYTHGLKLYRISGVFMMLMSAVLYMVVVLIVRDGNGFIYDGMLIYVMAIYDFYGFTRSAIYMTRTRKRNAPVINSIRVISIASSLISVLSLQTAMFASFGNPYDVEFQNIMNTITGTLVCLLMLSIGLTIIVVTTVMENRHKGRILPGENAKEEVEEEYEVEDGIEELVDELGDEDLENIPL